MQPKILVMNDPARVKHIVNDKIKGVKQIHKLFYSYNIPWFYTLLLIRCVGPQTIEDRACYNLIIPFKIHSECKALRSLQAAIVTV